MIAASSKKIIIVLTLTGLAVFLTGGFNFWSHYLKTAWSGFEPATSPVDAQLIFLGDIMLARHVERVSATRPEGAEFHFLSLPELVEDDDFVVANFESTVLDQHISTKNYTMRFAAPAGSLPALRGAGIQAVSLANNHTFDYSAAGFLQTKAHLEQAGVSAFGHPTKLDSDSIHYQTINGTEVAIIAAHTLFTTFSQENWRQVLTEAKEYSALQIVYIHWGEEYLTKHNQPQERLAKFLVAEGVDAIVGHHPHVVQDVAVIDGVPVFYSLGNFIFDQYFSEDVQKGLVLAMRIQSEQITEVELVPVTSLFSRTQPRLMDILDKEAFLAALASRSQSNLAADIKQGRLKLNAEVLE